MPSPNHPCRNSLRRQLMTAYAGALLLAVGLFVGALFVVLNWNFDVVVHRGLVLQAQWLHQAMRYDAAGRPVAVDVGHTSQWSWVYGTASEDLKFRVLDARGSVVLASEADALALVPEGRAFDGGLEHFQVRMGGVQLEVLTQPLEHAGSAGFYLQVARSERLQALARKAIGEPVLKAVLWMGLASLLIFSGVVYITMSRTLRPLRNLSAAAARIEPRNLSMRLEMLDLPTEMGPLVDAFNLALGRLETGYRVQQEFLAGAAHELKTPLALIRAQIEVEGAGRDETHRARLLKDVDLMARQVHQLLHLAEVSEAQNYVCEPLSLGSVASDATDYLSRLADRREVSLRLQVADGTAPLKADRSALFVLVKNLVENAIQHSPRGGSVTVAVDDDSLRVRDEGTGIAEGDFPRLFTRFWRGPARRDEGAGLGLAICQEIAVTHGWQLAARNARPGAEFTLRFAPP